VTASGSFAYAATFLWCCAAGAEAHKKRHQHTPRVIRLQSAMIRNINVRLAASSTIHNINAMFNFLPQIYPAQQRVCLAIITRYSTNFSLAAVKKLV
jgi:hypothetical protein